MRVHDTECTDGNPRWWNTPETVRSGKERVLSRHGPADGASDFHVEASLPGGSYKWQKTDALTLQATMQRSECLLQQQSGLRDSDRQKRLRALGFMLSFGRVTDRQTLLVEARVRRDPAYWHLSYMLCSYTRAQRHNKARDKHLQELHQFHCLHGLQGSTHRASLLQRGLQATSANLPALLAFTSVRW